MKRITVVFVVGFALWALGHPGPDIDNPYIRVPATPWMIYAGLVMMAVAALAIVIRVACPRPRLALLVSPSRLNRAEMAITMRMNGGNMPFISK